MIGLVNGSGAVVAEYAYDAWGNILSISGSGAGTVGAANLTRYRGSVRPVGATMEDWINAGSGSIWTQAVKSVVIKWDGGY